MQTITTARFEIDDAITIANPLLGSLKKVIQRVDKLKELAKAFYFDVMLSKFACPTCGNRFEIVTPTKWSCKCGLSIDPTLAFQKSSCCQARLIIRTFHYACRNCRKIVASRFLFDERIFDKAYFSERMAMSRRRKAEKREELRRLLAASRSGRFEMTGALDLDKIPGLCVDLDQFVCELQSDVALVPEMSDAYSIDTYRRHILDQLSWNPVLFSALSPVISDVRRDKIRRFVALIFMRQSGEVELTQSENDIWVQRVYYETDYQG